MFAVGVHEIDNCSATLERNLSWLRWFDFGLVTLSPFNWSLVSSTKVLLIANIHNSTGDNSFRLAISSLLSMKRQLASGRNQVFHFPNSCPMNDPP